MIFIWVFFFLQYFFLERVMMSTLAKEKLFLALKKRGSVCSPSIHESQQKEGRWRSKQWVPGCLMPPTLRNVYQQTKHVPRNGSGCGGRGDVQARQCSLGLRCRYLWWGRRLTWILAACLLLWKLPLALQKPNQNKKPPVLQTSSSCPHKSLNFPSIF